MSGTVRTMVGEVMVVVAMALVMVVSMGNALDPH
jgi:hypothetical protein